jgi:hypothetical protein
MYLLYSSSSIGAVERGGNGSLALAITRTHGTL